MGLKRKVYLSASQDVLNLELDPSLSVKTEVLFFEFNLNIIIT